MERQYAIAGTPEVNVTVRVRGMSQQQRYFDIQTITTRVTPDFIVVLVGETVELDSELHVTNLGTQIGGTYRVAWTSPYMEEGSYRAGLELLDPEGEIWEPGALFGPAEGSEGATPIVSLECRRCATRVSTGVSEAEPAALGEGFTISRHCDTCKATTAWAFCAEKPPAVETESEPILIDSQQTPGDAPATAHRENREKGRAPIKMGIKISRTKWGTPSHDLCETINVSRTGAYFGTHKFYELGEIVDVILPYHPDSVQIPLKARVMRVDEVPGTYDKRVAIHLLSGRP
jgi:hypothetical protein